MFRTDLGRWTNPERTGNKPMVGADAPAAAGDGPRRLREPRLLRPGGGRALGPAAGGAAGRCAAGGPIHPGAAQGPAAAGRGGSAVRRIPDGLGPRRQLPALRQSSAQPCAVERLRRTALLVGGPPVVPSLRGLHPLSGLLHPRCRPPRRATLGRPGLGNLCGRGRRLLHARLLRRSAAQHLHRLAGGGAGRTADPRDRPPAALGGR